jgi:hypothetical protein
VVSALGTGAVAAVVTGAERAAAAVPAALGPLEAPGEQAAGPASGAPVEPPEDLLQPLQAGSALSRWTVRELGPIADGALSIVLQDGGGRSFQLDVCARDPAPDAVAPPGRSDRFDVFLANGGDGSTATLEEHGLAAMALADVIRHNEHRREHAGYWTLAERLRRAPERVRVVVRG